ncbi:MAG: tRNA lysidine(34) synthetase TilS, partial [Oscillospiraceae bacterium]|nr:tRNA lysidine(34) synthetase TilS [Oscillospiraceae bacterium]
TKPVMQAQPVPIAAGEKVQFLGNSYILRKLSAEELENLKKIDKNYLNNCISCDTIKCNLFLRTRKTGDTFTFSARKVTKTLKKIFIEDKIPQKIRDTIAVLSDEQGNVVWVDGYGTNRPYKAEKHTENILIIEKI